MRNLLKAFSNYTFFDFSEEYGEIVLLPLVIISVSGFYQALVKGVNEVSILLDVLLLLIVLTALIGISLKRKNKLHTIWFREMPNILIYWYTFGFYFVIRIFQQSLTNRFAGPIYQVLFGLVAGTISLLLLSFHTKPWLKIRYKNRYKKIEGLRRKGRLKDEEWLAIRSQIVVSAKEKNKKSWNRKILEFILVMALASLLDAYSSWIADVIQNLLP